MSHEAAAQAYHQHGFGIVKGLFSAEELQLIEAQFERYVQEAISAPDPGEVLYEDLPSRPIRCVFRMHERSDYFRELMSDRRLIRTAQALFGGADVIPDGVMLIDKAPYASYTFPPHQDNAYQFWAPPEAVAATLALDESTPENGAIWDSRSIPPAQSAMRRRLHATKSTCGKSTRRSKPTPLERKA